MKRGGSKPIEKTDYTCIKLLLTLDKKELKKLQKFIKSPYFNSDQTLVKLLVYLMKTVLNNQVFSNEVQHYVYEKIFLEKVKQRILAKQQKEKLVRKLNTLGRLIEQFLVVESLKIKSVHNNNLLFEELIAKKQFGLLKRHLSNRQKKLQKQKIKDADYYHSQFKLNSYELENYYIQGVLEKKEEIDFEQVNLNLDLYYVIEKLNLNRSMLSLKKSLVKKFDPASIISISDLLKFPQYNNYIHVKVKKAEINLLKHPNEKTYYYLLGLIEQHAPLFDQKDLLHFYLNIVNFCVDKIKEDKFEFEELLKLYKKMDELNLNIENGAINIVYLKNLISAACKVGDFIWATQTLSKYIKYVDHTIQNNVYNLNYCAILYYKKLYEEALHYAIRVEPFDIVYDKTCRIMMMKCHYELDQEYDERKQLTTIDRSAYRNFFQIFINLYRIKHCVAKMTLTQLKEKLEQQKVNSDKAWLLSKIKVLEVSD